MPERRPETWVKVNPLDKIEQLLTCAVCLDRYRNPKLLPCQHTFCMEPCLENLVDLVKRIVKCPECRAEHTLPYEGVKAFQTNYTLMGFLEVHLEATEGNAELEAYIRRYNMERCKVCDEKAEVEYCAHCDKRICLDCKRTHTEMMKRDLTRLLNQVKRITNRVTEASDSLGRGLDSVVVNCETTKQEVHDYVSRFVRELKRREELLIAEIDAFSNSEINCMRLIRDNLELESSNINEACARVETCVKGEAELSQEDIVKYKRMFTEGLELLRTFNPDSDEFSVKRIRFAVGPDPHLLPHAISQFGELQVISPHYSSKPSCSRYVPRFINLTLESDNYPIKRRSCEPGMDSGNTTTKDTLGQRKVSDNTGNSYRTWLQAQDILPEGRERSLSASRYLRPQDSVATGTELRRSPQPHNRDENNSSSARQWEQRSSSPWARVQQLGDTQQPVLQVSEATTGAVSVSTNRSTTAANSSLTVHPADPPANIDRIQPPQISQQQQSSASGTRSGEDHALDERINNIRREHKALDERVESIRREHESRNTLKVGSPAPQQSSEVNDSPRTTTTATSSRERRSQARSKTLSEPILLDGHGLQQNLATQHSRETSPTEQQATEHIMIPVIHYPTTQQRHEHTRPTATAQVLRSSITAEDAVLVGNNSPPVQNPIDWKKYLIATDAAQDTQSSSGRSNATSSTANQRKSRSSSRELDDLDLDERRQHFIRSKTNPEFVLETRATGSPKITTEDLERAISQVREVKAINQGRSSSPSNTVTSENNTEGRRIRQRTSSNSDIAMTNTTSMALSSSPGSRDEDMERRSSRYRRKTEKCHSAYDLGSQAENDNDIDNSRLESDAQRQQLTTEKRQGTSPRFEISPVSSSSRANLPATDYQQKGRTLLKFGAKGSGNGQFNWPRGVAVLNNGSDSVVAICDSSNHRVQLFDQTGAHLRSFGSYGSAPGEFDCLAGVAVNKHRQFIVTDRYNHRVQIFDANGRFLREFGAHGQTNGRFSSPWGVVSDSNGFLYVCDKDNHRIQIFQADGNFVGKFGAIGNRDGQFQNPHFVACNYRNNNIIVSDSSNHRIQVFDHNGHFLSAFGTEGFQDGQFKYPRGVAVDDQGFIIVADSGNNRCQIFYPDGRFYATFGAWGNGDGQMKGVEGVAMLGSKIVATDRENHRVQFF